MWTDAFISILEKRGAGWERRRPLDHHFVGAHINVERDEDSHYPLDSLPVMRVVAVQEQSCGRRIVAELEGERRKKSKAKRT